MEYSEYNDPDWEYANTIHCWLNYASSDLQVFWSSFDASQKRVIAECLQSIADREEWE